MRAGSTDNPLRVAIIGSGPAGFYAADHLLKKSDLVAYVDMYDRLPTPFGLVRGGVAPDHQKIKNVTRVFDRIARHDHFCFFGNVEIGLHVEIDDLLQHYHAVIVATGAQTDRALGIPGEDLLGSYSATEFVAWYNGHPDFQDHSFPLDATDAVIVGVGNVAVDVARILCKTPAELDATDIADEALAALATSAVRNVHMLGRRGPAQAAFTTPEAKELGELEDADVVIDASEIELDEYSRAQATDKETLSKIAAINDLASRPCRSCSRRLHLRFLVSPVELLSDESGRVRAVKTVKNKLVMGSDGRMRPQPTDEYGEIPAQLVFRSVGYHGVPIAGLPFDDANGIIPNMQGRVTGADAEGLYVTGWIKRGPSGVIGTNKPDAVETVETLLSDLAGGNLNSPAKPSPASAFDLVCKRQPDHFSYDDWLCIDAKEMELGAPSGRPRVKLTRIQEMIDLLRERSQEATTSRT
jgi:ferredoxin/flavodoxin---NADP+ reductase